MQIGNQAKTYKSIRKGKEYQNHFSSFYIIISVDFNAHMNKVYWKRFLIKSSYRERKQVSWLLIFLWEVLWQFCYQIQSQVLWLLHICSFEIQGQILWLIHCRDVKVNVWKLYSVIFDYKVKFLNKKMCSINCGWLKETFWQYVTIFMG